MKFFLPLTIFIVAITLFYTNTATAVNLADQINSQIGAGANAAELGKVDSPQEAIAGMIKTLLTLLGTFMMVLVVFSGYMIFSARGDEDRLKKGQQTLQGAVIGLVIILSAYGLTLFVSQTILNANKGTIDTNTRPNVRINCQGLDCEARRF